MRAALITLAALAALAPPAAAASRVHQLVVFKDGHARTSNPTMAGTTAKVGKRRCAVPAATPLAALVRSGVGPLAIKDYGSCSKRASDAASLFVAGIGSEARRVHAADAPSGPGDRPDLAGVSLEDRDLERLEEPCRRRGPKSGRPCPDGVEDDRHPPCVRGPSARSMDST
jgi:hypothetical protein